MELLLFLLMLVGGVSIAAAVLLAASLASREREAQPVSGPTRDELEASILFHIAQLAGVAEARATETIRHVGGPIAPISREVDLTSWGERFARLSSRLECERMLERALLTAIAPGPRCSLPLYAALLDLSFALGFQTDALARLREKHPFDYADHAREGRPRSAEQRDPGSRPLFDRSETRARVLAVLGLPREADRPAITRTYRKLAALHHPDRFHSAPVEEREAASRRFLAIAEAYEQLLLLDEGR